MKTDSRDYYLIEGGVKRLVFANRESDGVIRCFIKDDLEWGSHPHHPRSEREIKFIKSLFESPQRGISALNLDRPDVWTDADFAALVDQPSTDFFSAILQKLTTHFNSADADFERVSEHDRVERYTNAARKCIEIARDAAQLEREVHELCPRKATDHKAETIGIYWYDGYDSGGPHKFDEVLEWVRKRPEAAREYHCENGETFAQYCVSHGIDFHPILSQPPQSVLIDKNQAALAWAASLLAVLLSTIAMAFMYQ